MSQNTDKKDKIKIEPDGHGERQGAISLDPTDAAGFMEHFSRMNPGDEVSGTFKAKLDEAGQKVVELSIIELDIDKPNEEDEGGGESEGAEEPEGEEEQPAAVQVVKNDDGVPENPNNLPPDAMPTH